MIVFGWGYQTIKNFGPAFKNYCDNCRNESFWMLVRVMHWFSLFFIPIFPYSIKYILTCPVCKNGLLLKGKQAQSIRALAEMNTLLTQGKIPEYEYKVKVGELKSLISQGGGAELSEKDIVVHGEKGVHDCTKCGVTLAKESRFCGHCGTKVASA